MEDYIFQLHQDHDATPKHGSVEDRNHPLESPPLCSSWFRVLGSGDVFDGFCKHVEPWSQRT